MTVLRILYKIIQKINNCRNLYKTIPLNFCLSSHFPLSGKIRRCSYWTLSSRFLVSVSLIHRVFGLRFLFSWSAMLRLSFICSKAMNGPMAMKLEIRTPVPWTCCQKGVRSLQVTKVAVMKKKKVYTSKGTFKTPQYWLHHSAAESRSMPRISVKGVSIEGLRSRDMAQFRIYLLLIISKPSPALLL